MSFSERNVAPRSPAGPNIPLGARRSLLTWFTQRGLSAPLLWEEFLHYEGYGTWNEIADDIRTRFGDAEANAWVSAMDMHFQRKQQQTVRGGGVNHDAEPALLVLPSPFFLDVLEHTLESMG